jgi:hypothetical protein
VPYWYWLLGQEVVAVQTPLMLWKPVWQEMQKLELKQVAQLFEQVRHLSLTLSG